MPFGRASHFGGQISHVPAPKPRHYAAELRTLSGIYPLRGSDLTDTTYYLSGMCLIKLKEFCLFCAINHTQPYRGLKLSQRHGQGSNLLPPDERAGNSTLQPIRLACCLSSYLSLTAFVTNLVALRSFDPL